MFATFQPTLAATCAHDFLDSEPSDFLQLAHLQRARQQQYERQLAQHIAKERRRQQQRQKQEEAEEQLAFLMHVARVRAVHAQADLERRRRAAQVQQQQMRERERARRTTTAAAAAYTPFRNGVSRRPLAARYGTSRRPVEVEFSSPNYHDLIGELFAADVDSQQGDDVQPEPQQQAADVDSQQGDDVQPEPQQQEEVDISQLLYRLLGQQETRDTDEGVELKHKNPSRQVDDKVDADPEEVDLAAAIFAAAAEKDAATVSSATDESGSDADVSDATASDDESAVDLSEASLEQLSRLADDFVSHRRDFVSPATLAFQSDTSSAAAGRSPTPPLAFGSTNASFLGYEDYLVTLLSKIDAIESHGVPQVKKARKQLVKQVEQELARLDQLKDAAWEKQSGHSSDSSSDESMSDDASPEPFEVLTLDSESSSADSLSDSSDSADNLSLSSSPGPESDTLAIKIPFLPVARDASPALSYVSSASSTLNAGDDEVAEILLAAHRLGDKVQELEEAEREQQELAELAHSEDSDSDDTDEDEDDVYFMYF